MESDDGRQTCPEFSHHGPDMAVDPAKGWARLREQCPAVWTDAHDGFWVLTGFDAVFSAMRDDATFMSGDGISIPPAPVRAVPLETDPPLTQKLRRMTQVEFAPSTVKARQTELRRLCDELIDAFIERGECDFVVELAMPLPARTILRRVGLDESRWHEFVSYVHTVVHQLETDPAAAGAAAIAFFGEVVGLIEERRTAGLRDDIASMLLTATLDGEPLTDDLLLSYLTLIIFGGLDTTSASIANALVRMQERPDVLAAIRSDPALLDVAVEEFLRLDTPLQALGRTVTRDISVAGQTLREGERVLLCMAAANRDPAVFENPDEIDLGRVENRHLAFGVGLHRCLGSHLGRSMFRTALEAIIERIPDYTLVGDPNQYRYPDSAYVYAHQHLPARFTPGSRRLA